MKVWFGFGSEHSSGIVMIGEFKSEEDAERIYELIKALTETAATEHAEGNMGRWGAEEKLSDPTRERLKELQLYDVSPNDLADFAFLDTSMDRHGACLRFRTDDSDIGGFVKLMVDHGAKVQVYCHHNWPSKDKTDEGDQDDAEE